MLMLLILIYIIMILAFIMILTNFIISKKLASSREKISPFECGFDPITPNHIPFSVHFFLISLIFLIFDIEITILIPLIYLFYSFNFYMIMTSFIFLIILLMGLYIEYLEESIDWKL
uniref:NADH-ubiquinone oxidoreductase chain 3 n=1 Tax=Crematogaster teranishii TaxID=2586727 RepID=A0A7L8Y489_9HYME|nr:NADH dehydrogenase subunit 3 [Crematogaster teranishii]QOI14043.1 NADH dehydrogenase subunit 3 [Crematogaster teranishii]